MTVAFQLNARNVSCDAAPDTPLLYVLRNDMALSSPKYGCGAAQCGACRVMVEGDIAASCVLPLRDAAGKAVVTLEGLGDRSGLHPLQQAFIDEQAAQCGFCTPGMIMAAAVLLARNPDPSDADIREALERNLCRCGCYPRIVKAVRRAAKAIAQ